MIGIGSYTWIRSMTQVFSTLLCSDVCKIEFGVNSFGKDDEVWKIYLKSEPKNRSTQLKWRPYRDILKGLQAMWSMDSLLGHINTQAAKKFIPTCNLGCSTKNNKIEAMHIKSLYLCFLACNFHCSHTWNYMTLQVIVMITSD